MSSLTSRLRKAIRDSDKTICAIARECRLNSPGIYGFVEGRQTITLRTADRLCDYFGLELRQARENENGRSNGDD